MAVLLGAALTCAGCQDGYPIAATRCDRACRVGQGPECEGYSPADCVVGCEAALRGSDCVEEFEELLSCIEEHGLNLVCERSGSEAVEDCEVERKRNAGCVRQTPRPESSSE